MRYLIILGLGALMFLAGVGLALITSKSAPEQKKTSYATPVSGGDQGTASIPGNSA